MKDFYFENLEIPDELVTRISKINLLICHKQEDINDYLSGLFISDEFCIEVFHRKLDESDWEKIYYGLTSVKGQKKFKNNGILFEHFSNKILSEKFLLNNIINFGDLNFEDPEKGSDLIFIDSDCKLQFYEVKSRCTKKKLGNEDDLVELIKKGIISTFCKKIKNVNKLVDAKKNLPDKHKSDVCYELLQDMLHNKSNMIKYVNNENIDFNICVIGETIDIDQDAFNQKIIDVFMSTKYCNKKCINNHENYCKKILDKIKVFNIINIQFRGHLDLEIIYNRIISKIDKMGVIND